MVIFIVRMLFSRTARAGFCGKEQDLVLLYAFAKRTRDGNTIVIRSVVLPAMNGSSTT